MWISLALRDLMIANWWIKTSDDSNSFKYGPSDLCCDYPMPIRGIPLTPHQSTRIIVIPSHEMTTCQHHSDVVLQSHATSLMRSETICSLDFVCPVCSTSLTNSCTVTCRAFFRLYCWRVRSFRFFLASDDCCWVTVADKSDCGDGVDDLIASGVDVIAEDGLALDTPSSLIVSLFVIACISRSKLSIIAWTAFIVTGVSAIWVVGILLNNRMA